MVARGLPTGIFLLLFAEDRPIAQGLVADARIKAVALARWRIGRTTLMKIAAERPELKRPEFHNFLSVASDAALQAPTATLLTSGSF